MPDKPIKLIRTDLDAAREAWIREARSKEERNERRQSDFLAYRDGAGRVVGFHALRHTYISRLVASGANIKVAQELARHSTPTLTLGRYAHVQLVGPAAGPGRPARLRGPTGQRRSPGSHRNVRRRSECSNRLAQKARALHGDGTPHRSIIPRQCRCLDCGQVRMDKEYL